MKNKRLFFLIESLSYSAGTERIATELANVLQAEGMNVGFIVLSDITNSFFQLKKDILIYSLGCAFKQRWKSIINLRKLLKREAPDFIINVGVSMGQISLPAAWGLRIKVIGWEHFNLYAGSKLGYFWRLLAAKLCYKTVVLTQKDRFDYLEKVNADIVCIPNFITRFIKSKSKLESKIVLSVGRLTSQKGYDLLLQAWQKVIQQIPDWKLQIIGSGEDEKELKMQAFDLEILESVSFIPATNNVAQYYEQASLYVMSSRFEGMPMVLLEAKMHGLPCVSFTCPNGPDEIIRNRIDGLVVELGNVNALAEAMLELIRDKNKLEKFSERAKEDALMKYTAQKAVKQWCKVFS